MNNSKYPIYKPLVTNKEKKYVNECLDEGWISSKGRFINEFENKFSEYLNINHSISTTSGTTALHLAFIALGIKKGDEVILPSLTFVATANAISYTGATPVFADSKEDTYVLNVSNLNKLITPKTKAIVAVHLYGNACDMEPLVEFCNKNNLYLIEDCAEALGTKYKSQFVGTFGDISCFSFYGNKTISTGEGGMICTDSLEFAEKITLFKQQGFNPYENNYYNHSVIGYNYRMTNICAAIGLAQIENIENILTHKNNIANLYQKNIRNIEGLTLQKTTENSESSYWLISATCDIKSRDSLILFLKELDIETRSFFTPLNALDIYKDYREETPVSISLSKRGISFPSYPGLTENDIQHICSKIYNFFKT